eukprot:Tbor_TRINITY_DN3022_c0_g2::TRINITY_DN3022_c0_g2_i1::g.17440::m.17440
MPKLAVLATIFEAVKTRPARPLREFFQAPQAPIREMYMYRFMVNLMWYARNYTNMALAWSMIVCMFAPIFSFNFIAAVALHFWKLSLTSGSPSSLVSDSDINGRRGITPSVQNLFGASRMLVGIRDSSLQLLTGLKGSFRCNDTSSIYDGKYNSTYEFPNKKKSVKDMEKQLRYPKPQLPENNIKPKKLTPTIIAVTQILKLMQLICCGVTLHAYGFLVSTFCVMVPILFVFIHALMTPYSDTASEYFEKAGGEAEAPSTPVLAFQVRSETSFGVAREKLAKAAMEKGVDPESPTTASNWTDS